MNTGNTGTQAYQVAKSDFCDLCFHYYTYQLYAGSNGFKDSIFSDKSLTSVANFMKYCSDYKEFVGSTARAKR